MVTDDPSVDSDTSPIVLRTWSPDGSLDLPNRAPEPKVVARADEGATAPGASRARAPAHGRGDPEATVDKYMRRWEEAVAVTQPQLPLEHTSRSSKATRPKKRPRAEEPSLLLIAFGSFAGTLAAGGTALGVFLMVI